MTNTSEAAADYCYITTTGRVTGRLHTIEIWFAIERQTLYVLAGGGHRADFVRNAKKQPDVSIRIGSRTASECNATARLVSDDREDALARRLLLEKYASSGSDLVEWGRTALPVAFDLAG
jgi:deazaflavin-dependent oxidoreductase (nitroreductase family)